MQYVAFLRGIMPMNPNMRNEKLRGVFEALGFTNVKTVIASGNVLFESPSQNQDTLETTIEHAITKQLDFTSTTILRSRTQLEELVARDPFKGHSDGPTSKLNVTFLKHEPRVKIEFPINSSLGDYTLLGIHDRAIFSVIDITRAKSPDLMAWLEKTYGKEITTRTWGTVNRCLKGLK